MNSESPLRKRWKGCSSCFGGVVANGVSDLLLKSATLTARSCGAMMTQRLPPSQAPSVTSP
jgi:hypothetical protein